MKRASKAFITILVSLTLCPACTTMQLASEAANTAMNFGRQVSEQRSFIGSSTLIFYPDGVPDDIEQLPPLSQESLDRITKDLEAQSAILLRALHSNAKPLARIFKRNLNNVERQRVRLLNSGQAVALVATNGEIEIDVRVVQAIYRGVLLTSLIDGSDSLDATALKVSQKEALDKLLQNRTRFLRSIPSPTLSAIDAGAKAIAGTGLSLQSAYTVMNSALEDWVAMYSSVKASQSYDDAISFVVAHEIAHRALQHYDRLQSGAALQDLETEADRLAALLVVLARNTKVYPDDDYILFGPPPGRITITRKDFFGDPESICLLDLNYKPSGHISFFRYGYSFSGFDSLGKGNAMIVPSAVRLAIASSVSDAAVWAIREAQWDTGTCHNSNKELQAVAQDPEGQISRLLGEARTEGDKHSDKTAEPDSDIQYEFRRSTIAANEPQVVKTIYLEYFEQLRR